MPKFSPDYPAKSSPVDNDKLLIADSEASNAIKSVTKAALEKGLSGGTLANVVYFTSSGTYTKPAKLKYVIVEVIGGGGGAGGKAASQATTGSAAGGSGGGGGYSRKKILASALGTTESVTVGSGGSAGGSGATAGGTGGTSLFGSHLQATGGAGGGAPSAAGQVVNFYDGSPGDGGVGSGGDFNLYGTPAIPNVCLPPRTVAMPSGSSYYGGSVISVAAGSAGNNAAVAGRVPGGGASGSTAGAGQTASAGAIGGAGIVIVNEYY